MGKREQERAVFVARHAVAEDDEGLSARGRVEAVVDAFASGIADFRRGE
jgi:hypothetical protein